MRSLKRRIITATPVSPPRSKRLAVIRWIYLLSLFGIGLWLANLFMGDRIFFRSEGLVLGEPAIIAAEFPVTVRDIKVKEGETIAEGQIAAIVSSQSVAENIARLNAELAARAARQTELRIRGEAVEAMLSLAQNRQKFASSALKTLESLREQRFLGVLQHSTAIEQEYRSYQDLETLKSEKQIIESELATLTGVVSGLANAIGNLQQLYQEGRLQSPMAGVVVRIAANRGSVIRAGEPLVEIYGAERHILAYVRPGGLYEVNVGDEVKITTGLKTQRGIVKRVEPFAAALPREFQRAFIPVDRQQVIRVELAPGETPPPLFTKVGVTSTEIVPPWAQRLWDRLRTQVSSAWLHLVAPLTT